MAAIHAEAMTVPPPWGAPTFRGFLSAPGVVVAFEPEGFALGRVIADEAELLTLAILPPARRKGLASACLAGFEDKASAKGARRVFLEVAITNTAAKGLYEKSGYSEAGRRPEYYRIKGQAPISAILMTKTL
ncbi:MAG: GNAT family N-acetyltransferase [Paracoccaceae bacterium]|nr:GNAT family N-acetyltransferase [Paracoccaceae bacterium]